MSFDLVLKPSCEACGAKSDLDGTECKHTTLCTSCGKTMVEDRGRCNLCGTFITKLIRDDEDEEGEEGGLSNSGKELKKLLGKAAGANESDAEDDDDDVQLIIDIFRHLYVDEDDENTISPVLAPKDEPAGNSPLKPTSGSARGTSSTSMSIKGKRTSGSDEVKTANGAPAKKIKVENESNSSVKVENTISPVLAPKDAPKDEPAGNSPLKPTSGSARGTSSTSMSIEGKRTSGSDEVKTANGAPAEKIKVENESNSSVKVEPPSSSKTSVALKGSGSTNVKIGQSSSGFLITEAEIRAAILEKAQTAKELVSRFKPRIKTMQDRKSFTEIMKKIARINKKNGVPFVKLKE